MLSGSDATNPSARRAAIADVQSRLAQDGLQPVAADNLAAILEAFE